MVKKFQDRLKELSTLEDGWTEYGSKVEKELLSFLAEVTPRIVVEAEVPIPEVFPTMEGGVQLEWVLGDWELEFLFLRDSEDAEVYGVSTVSEDSFEEDISRTDVERMIQILQKFRSFLLDNAPAL